MFLNNLTQSFITFLFRRLGITVGCYDWQEVECVRNPLRTGIFLLPYRAEWGKFHPPPYKNEKNELFHLGQRKFNRYKNKYKFLYINGGNLTFKYPPNAMVFCIDIEQIKLYNVLIYHQISSSGMAIIKGKKSAKIRILADS